MRNGCLIFLCSGADVFPHCQRVSISLKRMQRAIAALTAAKPLFARRIIENARGRAEKNDMREDAIGNQTTSHEEVSGKRG